MYKRHQFTRKSAGLTALITCLTLLPVASLAQGVHNLYASASGSAQWAWNSRYGPSGWATGGTSIGVGLQMNAPYGNDYTVGIFEIPIAPLLSTGALLNANLVLNSTGFGTGYYYGSAAIGWLDTTSYTLTGNPVTDGLNGPSQGVPNNFTLYNYYDGAGPTDGTPQTLTFNVTSLVAADIAAGRSFTTFVISGSRDTYGGIYTALAGSPSGPMIVATAIPEPSVYAVCAGLAALGLVILRRRLG
jgi:hypothetical protein